MREKKEVISQALETILYLAQAMRRTSRPQGPYTGSILRLQAWRRRRQDTRTAKNARNMRHCAARCIPKVSYWPGSLWTSARTGNEWGMHQYYVDGDWWI